MECSGGTVDCQPEVDTGTQNQQAEKEMQKYIRRDPGSNCPLIWWQSTRAKYPILSMLAQNYLCVPVTSVPSERVCSIAGQVVNRRSCPNPDSINKLVLLAENLSNWS